MLKSMKRPRQWGRGRARETGRPAIQMAMGMVEQAQVSTVGKAAKEMKRGLRGRSMIRRFGLILTMGLLAIGLLAVPLGASAAPAGATGVAATTSSAAYYDPTIYVPYSVASGDPIYIEGYG